MIVLLGGSSQVAIEVAIYLNKSGLKSLSILRDEYSAVFHKMLNLPYCVCELDSKEFQNVLGQATVVADFIFPSGLGAQVIQKTEENFLKVFPFISSECTYVYMSSIWAHGMGPNETKLRYYKFPRGQYAYAKRQIEKLNKKYASKYKCKYVNLRLGQVHGYLQSVSPDYKYQSYASSINLNVSANEKVNIIFTFQISEILTSVAQNRFSEGTFTGIMPQNWSLQDLYDFYGFQLNTKFNLYYNSTTKSSFSVTSLLKKAVLAYRPILESYVLYNLPAIAVKVKARYRNIKVASVSAPLSMGLDNAPDHLIGSCPTEIFPIKFDNQSIATQWNWLKDLIDSQINQFDGK